MKTIQHVFFWKATEFRRHHFVQLGKPWGTIQKNDKNECDVYWNHWTFEGHKVLYLWQGHNENNMFWDQLEANEGHAWRQVTGPELCSFLKEINDGLYECSLRTQWRNVLRVMWCHIAERKGGPKVILKNPVVSPVTTMVPKNSMSKKTKENDTLHIYLLDESLNERHNKHISKWAWEPFKSHWQTNSSLSNNIK